MLFNREHLLFEQKVKREELFFLLFSVQQDGAPGRTRTCAILLRSYAVQNSKCRFWCRLRGSASFISPLNWTELGLKLEFAVLGNCERYFCRRFGRMTGSSSGIGLGKSCRLSRSWPIRQRGITARSVADGVRSVPPTLCIVVGWRLLRYDRFLRKAGCGTQL